MHDKTRENDISMHPGDDLLRDIPAETSYLVKGRGYGFEEFDPISLDHYDFLDELYYEESEYYELDEYDFDDEYDDF